MDDLIALVGPYVLWAIAVGGLVYPWRLWGINRRRFVELYACIVIGVAVGFFTDDWPEGLRNGLVIGAIAMPALMRARRDNSPVRTESDGVHEGTAARGGEHERSENSEGSGDSG